MKKLKLKIILVVTLGLIGLMLTTGCGNTFDPMKNGYNATVIYDFNGEQFDDLSVKTFRFKPDTKIIEPTTNNNASSLVIPSKAGYHVSSWHKAETDENGDPIKVDGKFRLSNEEWNFKTDLSGGENSVIYLVAIWSKNYTFTIDVGEEAQAAGVQNIVNTNYSTESGLSKPGKDPKWQKHTLYYYYYFEKDGKPVSKDEGGEKTRISDSAWRNIIINDETPEITVYVEWLDGEWIIVNSATQLDQYSVQSGKNYILDADIDFKGGDFAGIQGFSGIFDGNGYKIKNFKHEETIVSNENVGLFTFVSGGTIKNLTFENCEVVYTFGTKPRSGTYTVGFLAANGGNATRFEKLGFTGCKLTVVRQGAAYEAKFIFGNADTFGVFGKTNNGTKITDNQGLDISVTLDGATQNTDTPNKD